MSGTLTASIVGASGYTGGELLRLLLQHPHIRVQQVTSERLDGQFVHFTHPNLRGRTTLKFSAAASLAPCDLLFLGLPHGSAMERIDTFAALAPRIVDLSADFRLREASAYDRWYGHPHARPEWLHRFVYGLPELHRDSLSTATHVSGVGCNATATTLAIWPLAKAQLIDVTRGVICEVKVGSSEGGAASSDSTHHPERAGVMRSFAPTGHRHTGDCGATTGHTSRSPRRERAVFNARQRVREQDIECGRARTADAHTGATAQADRCRCGEREHLDTGFGLGDDVDRASAIDLGAFDAGERDPVDQIARERHANRKRSACAAAKRDRNRRSARKGVDR